MKIGIIGAGSIGLLFAAHLSQTASVVIYTRTKKQAEEINKNGIRLLKGTEESYAAVKALEFAKWNGDEPFAFIAVKQYQLGDVLAKLKEFKQNKMNLYFLQNGMGHLKQLEPFTRQNIFVGSIEHGAFKENANTVRQNGNGITNLALFKGEIGPLYQIASLFSEGFPVKVQEDYYEMLVNKLIINAVINPLTAILQVKNGELIQNPHYFQVVKDLFFEVSLILGLNNHQDYLQKIIHVCQTTAENRSSMLKDLDGGAQTEVDAILGFLLEEKGAQKAPLIESFYQLIKGKEK